MAPLLHRAAIKKKEDRNHRAKIYWSALLHRATIIKQQTCNVNALYKAIVDHTLPTLCTPITPGSDGMVPSAAA